MRKKIESLLWNYKNNKAESKMLSFRLDLQAVDYSKDRVQTSNKSDLSDIVIAREKKLNQIREDINTVEALISTLTSKERAIIKGYYIDRKTLSEIGEEIGFYRKGTVASNRDKALDKMTNLYMRVYGEQH